MELDNTGTVLLKVENSDIQEDGSFTIPHGITEISTWVFYKCSHLRTITLPLGITLIGNGAFWNCRNLQVITLPPGITSIGYNAFENCRSLQAITLPPGIMSIGENAFYNCHRLQAITLPPELTSIGYNTFENCSSLQAITLPPGITSIGNRAFWNCRNLQAITLPPGITSIGYNTFRDCHRLQTITLPAGITSIYAGAFYNCHRLHNIVIDGPDEERERIKALLPGELQDKVTSAGLAAQAYQALEEQLARIANPAQFNPLYRYLSTNVSDHETVFGIRKNDHQQNIRVEYPLLPDELFQHINGFIEQAFPAHRHAKELMYRLPLPRNEDQFITYRRTLEHIANTTVAMFTQQYKSDFEKHLYFLQKKAAFFARNHHPAAAEAVETLYQQLMNSYIYTLPQNSVQFQNECRQAIQATRNELEQYRGWKLILSYLLLLATGLGALVVLADVGYHYATGKHFSFFQTTTGKQLHALEGVIPNNIEFPELEAGVYGG